MKEQSSKTVYFDMDGTIFDLYSVPNWLNHLQNHNPLPYLNAEPLVDLYQLAECIRQKQKQGYQFGIISWLSKNSTPAYDKQVREIKRKVINALGVNLFDEIHIVKYGTPKHQVAKVKGILIDDDEKIRSKWDKYGGQSIDPNQTDILDFLKKF